MGSGLLALHVTHGRLGRQICEFCVAFASWFLAPEWLCEALDAGQPRVCLNSTLTVPYQPTHLHGQEHLVDVTTHGCVYYLARRVDSTCPLEAP